MNKNSNSIQYNQSAKWGLYHKSSGSDFNVTLNIIITPTPTTTTTAGAAALAVISLLLLLFLLTLKKTHQNVKMQYCNM